MNNNFASRVFSSLLLSILIAGPVLAEEENQGMPTCEGVALIAEIIMKSRQAGVSLSRSLEIAEGDELLREIALRAYEQPRMSTPQNQQRMIEDFRDELHLECIRATE